jgi:hypothetical protein
VVEDFASENVAYLELRTTPKVLTSVNEVSACYIGLFCKVK